MLPKIAIIYLSFHCEPYIDDVISALKKMTYPKERVEFIIVDNPHPEHSSSIRFITETVMPLSGNEIPHVTLLPQEKNLGFAGGNNVGIRWALEHDFDYVYFHNNDGFMAANCLEPIVAAMEEDRTIGAAQSLMLLYPEANLINTSGNSLHYLMIGYCNNFREPKDRVTMALVTDTGYASGAAMLLRADLLKKYGEWDADFWLYHEDIEYSLRLKSVGYRVVVARDSIFYHKYSFSRNTEKFYYIERNRFGVMLMFFKWPTLILFVPIALALELGMLLFAWQGGWLSAKLNAYRYWLRLEHWRLWLGKRHKIQKLRTIGDRKLLANAVSEVHFEEKSINSPLLRYIGNPLMAAYWWVIRHLILW